MQRKQKGTAHATFVCCCSTGAQTSPNMTDPTLPTRGTDFFLLLHFKQDPLGFFALTAATNIHSNYAHAIADFSHKI